jgi:TonB-linked SusC/RagA family outer membrane protein
MSLHVLKRRFYAKTVMVAVAALLSIQLYAQQRTVSGTVTDGKGVTLPGVNIVVKGSLSGAVTDANGKFSISVPGNDAVLRATSIGYTPVEITVGDQTVLNFTMQEEISELDEVVVVGYGTVRKRDLTGSVQSVKNEDITAIPTNNVLEVLQGKVAGLDLTKSSGQAGSGVSFTIRGNRSLKASNEPLVIVDGFPYGNEVDINPTDIESIEILKDAASTAIYGTRGANGVILITTKKGKNEKARVNFSAYYSINNVTDYIPSFNNEEYHRHRMEGQRTISGNEMATGTFVANPLITYTPGSTTDLGAAYFANAAEKSLYDAGEYVDWLSMIFHTGHSQNYELNITGGSTGTQYSASLGFMKEESVIPNDGMKRFNTRLSLTQKIVKSLTFGANIMYSYRNADNGFESAFNQAGKMIPIAKIYDDKGLMNPFPAPGYNTKFNPLYYFDHPDLYVDNNLHKRAIINTDLSWEIIPGMTAKTLFSAHVRDRRRGRYYDNLDSKIPTSTIDDELYTGWQSQNVINYNKDLDQHHFQIMAGHEFQTWFRETATAQGTKQPLAINSFHYLLSTTADQRISSQLTDASMMSFFGRVNYRFTERYLLNVSLRADRSSVLAKEHQWGYFPAVAAAWRISEEEFLKSVAAVSNLKLRLSWGVSGNSAIDPYQTQGLLGTGYNTFGSTTAGGFYPMDFSNPTLTWETTSSYNVGLDYGLLKNRISGSVDFFVANTKNLLMPRKLPTTSGYADAMENVGSTQNTGIEGLISAQIIQNGKNGLNWSADFTVTHVKEEITALFGGQDRDVVNNWFVGEPIRVYYDYKKVGIWQIPEAAEAIANGQAVGEIKVADADGSGGTITPEDRVVYNRSPKIVLGFNNTFSYRGFDLSAFVFARLGQWIEVGDYGQVFWNGLENSPKHDYWTPENPTNAYPRPHNQRSTGQYPYNSTLNKFDGSFVKLRDVTLGYSLPETLLQKLNLSQLRFYVSAKNYWMWTKIDHYDPERGGGESWPMFKQVIFGLNLNF